MQNALKWWPLVYLAVALGCSSTEEIEQGQSGITGGSSGSSGSAGGGGRLAACGGRKSCMDAYALRTLFSSSLAVKGTSVAEGASQPAGEVVAASIKPSESSISTVEVETKPAGTKLEVTIILRHIDRKDPEGPDGACSFDFTIDGDRIVEREVQATCAE
jgi:hypothetical protein